jgi:DNA primase
LCQSAERYKELLSERIKAKITVFDFVGEYVQLKTTSNGAVGLCPFHEDHRPSFGVNIQENYWHCFAGCGGGSVIDFWMKWRGCDFSTAATELAHMLLE